MDKRIIVLSGMPASGKDTVTERLHEIDPRYANLKKYRTIGQDDKPKSSYYNVTVKEFITKVNNGDFLQYHRRYDRYYGIDKRILTEMLNCGQIPIIHIGRIENYYTFLSNVKSFEEESGFTLKIASILLWEQKGVLEARIVNRDKTKDEIVKRIAAMNQEYSDAVDMMQKEERPFTLVIHNTNIDETVNKIIAIESQIPFDNGYDEFWNYLRQVEE